jgi:hypothetical protein
MSGKSSQEVTQVTTTDPIAWTGLGRLRGAWYRIRFTVQEMNYASRRLVGPLTSNSVDAQWRSR